tara:strand:- start:262 stop:795 length:534 start_codon:yes stop_codon:yes gene_type:complete
MKLAVIAALMLSAGTVHAAEKAPPPEPMEHPDWGKLRRDFEAKVQSGLYDPESAQFTWVKGFQWGSVTEGFFRRRWGWVACAKVNAKNRMGGYVGASKYWILYEPSKGLSWDLKSTSFSQCDKPEPVALQPELVDLASLSDQTSLADELTKLGSLLEKGLITRAEFDAQKAKMLGRQ